MIDLERYHNFLYDQGVKFLTGVPDSLLNDFCLYASKLPKERNIIAANEGNAIALAAGNYIATGNVPLIYMQNSGIGNAVNPLLSLTNKEVYSIPMVLLIGWRGDPAVKDHPHHKLQGELTPVLLNAMKIPFKVIENDGEKAYEVTKWAIEKAREIDGPTALIAKKNTLAQPKKKTGVEENSQFDLSREEAIRCVLESIPENSICIASTGRATRELYEQRNIKGMPHDTDYLNVGSMGHGSSVAMGIAVAKKKRLVVTFDGDAAAIMHLGALTTVGKHKQSNMLHIVLNNGMHESVGGQPSAGHFVNLTNIAENSGYETIGKAVISESEVKAAVKELLEKEGPKFLDIHIRTGIRNDLPLLHVVHTETKEALMKELSKDND